MRGIRSRPSLQYCEVMLRLCLLAASGGMMNSSASEATRSPKSHPAHSPETKPDGAPRTSGSLSALAAVLVAVLGTGGMGTAWVQSKSNVKELEADLKLEQGKRAESDKQLEANRLELAKKNAEIERKQAEIAALNEQLAKAKSESASASADHATVHQQGNYNAGIQSSVTVTRHP